MANIDDRLINKLLFKTLEALEKLEDADSMLINLESINEDNELRDRYREVEGAVMLLVDALEDMKKCEKARKEERNAK